MAVYTVTFIVPVAGKRCCPLEDCGGPQGFAELLTALQDASHPSHEEISEWLGDFAPESFSVDEVNRRLRRRGNIENTSRTLHLKMGGALSPEQQSRH